MDTLTPPTSRELLYIFAKQESMAFYDWASQYNTRHLDVIINSGKPFSSTDLWSEYEKKRFKKYLETPSVENQPKIKTQASAVLKWISKYFFLFLMVLPVVAVSQKKTVYTKDSSISVTTTDSNHVNVSYLGKNIPNSVALKRLPNYNGVSLDSFLVISSYIGSNGKDSSDVELWKNYGVSPPDDLYKRFGLPCKCPKKKPIHKPIKRKKK